MHRGLQLDYYTRIPKRFSRSLHLDIALASNHWLKYTKKGQARHSSCILDGIPVSRASIPVPLLNNTRACLLIVYRAVVASVVGPYFRYQLTYTHDFNWHEAIYICTM